VRSAYLESSLHQTLTLTLTIALTLALTLTLTLTQIGGQHTSKVIFRRTKAKPPRTGIATPPPPQVHP